MAWSWGRELGISINLLIFSSGLMRLVIVLDEVNSILNKKAEC